MVPVVNIIAGGFTALFGIPASLWLFDESSSSEAFLGSVPGLPVISTPTLGCLSRETGSGTSWLPLKLAFG